MTPQQIVEATQRLMEKATAKARRNPGTPQTTYSPADIRVLAEQAGQHRRHADGLDRILAEHDIQLAEYGYADDNPVRERALGDLDAA